MSFEVESQGPLKQYSQSSSQFHKINRYNANLYNDQHRLEENFVHTSFDPWRRFLLFFTYDSKTKMPTRSSSHILLEQVRLGKQTRVYNSRSVSIYNEKTIRVTLLNQEAV